MQGQSCILAYVGHGLAGVCQCVSGSLEKIKHEKKHVSYFLLSAAYIS